MFENFLESLIFVEKDILKDLLLEYEISFSINF